MEKLANELQLLVNAVQKAQKAGVYELQESAVLFQAIQNISEAVNPKQEEEVTDTPEPAETEAE